MSFCEAPKLLGTEEFMKVNLERELTIRDDNRVDEKAREDIKVLRISGSIGTKLC